MGEQVKLETGMRLAGALVVYICVCLRETSYEISVMKRD